MVTKLIRDKYLKNNENTIKPSNNEPNESIISNEPNESIIYELLKKVANALEKSTINNNEELMNNSLKTINTLATTISLKKQSNFDNTLVEQLNIDNTEQSNTDNTKPLNTDNTAQLNTDNTEQLNTDNTFVTLSKWLKSLKCIINPINDKKDDNKCFQYPVALSRHREIGSNCNKISKIKPFLQHFNFENINYPLKKEDHKIFEKNNESVSLVVFKPDKERKKVYYHFKSKYIEKRRTKIFLLLLENKHYTYVTKPHILSKYIKNELLS